MTTKTIFHAFSYSPKNNVFWQVFLCKYARVIRIFSSLLLHWPVCQKWCAHDCIRNQKCCDRKFGTVLKKSRTEQNSCYCPDPKPPPPTPVRPRGAARTGEGGAIGWQSHRSPMPLWNFRNGLRRLGPCCGASVGTTGSAPCALRCRPWSVVRGLCWNHWFRPLCACVPVLSQKCANAAAGQHATREQWIRFMGFALRESLRPWSIANWQNSIFSRLRCIDVQKLEKYDEKLQKMYGFLAFSSYRCPRIPIFLVFGITTQNLCKTRPYLVIPVRKMGCFF